MKHDVHRPSSIVRYSSSVSLSVNVRRYMIETDRQISARRITPLARSPSIAIEQTIWDRTNRYAKVVLKVGKSENNDKRLFDRDVTKNDNGFSGALQTVRFR